MTYKYKQKCTLKHTTRIGVNSTFEGMNAINKNTYFRGKLGLGSYIGNDCHLTAYIGRFTSIAPYVRSNPGKHPISKPYVSTSPCFYSTKKQCGHTFAKKQMFEEESYIDIENRIAIKIGNDCWIGQGVFFTGGITVGDGAIVLANAVITKNIPPYSIVGGIPAKIIKYRFDEDTINFLLQIKWWNNDTEWLNNHWDLICDIEKLKEYYNPTYNN